MDTSGKVSNRKYAPSRTELVFFLIIVILAAQGQQGTYYIYHYLPKDRGIKLS